MKKTDKRLYWETKLRGRSGQYRDKGHTVAFTEAGDSYFVDKFAVACSWDVRSCAKVKRGTGLVFKVYDTLRGHCDE